MKIFKLRNIFFARLFFIVFLFYRPLVNAQSSVKNCLPPESRQLIIVLADSAKAVKGALFLLEFDGKTGKWFQPLVKMPVVLGRSGLGWSAGASVPDTLELPLKKEGDGRSPAGIFSLGPVFGIKTSEEMKQLKMPYLPLTDMLECVDDINSRYYNRLIERDSAGGIDWKSSEKMKQTGAWYEQGIVVNHNVNPVIKGAGSCIFIHNWAAPDETSSGCTELEPARLTELIRRLDASSHPALVQLTYQLYSVYKIKWNLPEIPELFP
jgi:D-alanyl-D-alanine dipeptidase